MTVKELITFLQAQPQDLQVAYAKYSEHTLLEKEEIVIKSLQVYRPDGWIHEWRIDKLNQLYLVFPGN